MPENAREIYCQICSGWFDYLGGGVLKPDVIYNESACGHLLPAAVLRDKESTTSEPHPEPEEPEQHVDEIITIDVPHKLNAEEEAALEALKRSLGAV